MKSTVGTQMDSKQMGAFQWAVIAQCFLINMLDGFDVLVMAFAAASVSAHWTLTGTQLGYLLSAGLVGMALGSLFVAPWADRIGRRPLMLLCVTIAGVGMLACAYATSALALGLLRVLTGLGIGGILASSYVIAGEYANQRWRSLAISLQATAYALGATIGELIAARIIPALGWQSVFFYGGIVTLSTLVVLLTWLPESLDFLLTRQPKNALQRINRLLTRVGIDHLQTLPNVTGRVAVTMGQSIAQLFAPATRRPTQMIWIAFFLVMFGFYFVMSWTPRLLVAAGLSTQQGITGGVLLNVGGILGTTLIGLLAARFALAKVLAAYLLLNALLMVGFAWSLGQLHIGFGLVLLIGIFVNGCVAGLYALTPTLYTTEQRVTGLGWGIGIGRMGAIVSPLVAGKLIDADWQPADLYPLFAMAFVLAALAVSLMKPIAIAPLGRTSQP